MQLVYTATQQPVKVGDVVTVMGFALTVHSIPSVEDAYDDQAVSLAMAGAENPLPYDPNTIGAEWV